MRTNRANTGLPFEQRVVASAAKYQALGILRLRKVTPPVRVIGGGAFRKIIFLENPFLDLVGCWTERDGRAVFIECKSTKTPKLCFDSSAGVSRAQLDALRHWHIAGAVAFVLWEHAGKVRLVTAAVLIYARDKARAGEHFKYIKWESFEPDLSDFDSGTFDFLQRMRSFWPR